MSVKSFSSKDFPMSYARHACAIFKILHTFSFIHCVFYHDNKMITCFH